MYVKSQEKRIDFDKKDDIKRKKIKPSNGRNEQNVYWQISRKETLYKKKYWVFLE